MLRGKLAGQFAFVSIILLAGVLANAAAKTALKFAWPIPSHVWVTETMLMKGETAKLKYEVVLSVDERSNNLALRLQNFSFIEMAGVDLKDPTSQKEVQQVLAMTSAIPIMSISREGKFLDITGFDEMVTKVVGAFPDQATRTRVEQTMRSPQMIQMMKQKCSEFWKVWVSFWLDVDVPQQGFVKINQRIPMPDGSSVDTPALVVNKGPDKTNPEHVVLEMESTLEGDAPTKSMGRFLENISRQNPPQNGKKPFNADMMEKMYRITRFRLITDPKTMRPTYASMESTNTIKIKGESEQSQVEKHEYLFDWK